MSVKGVYEMTADSGWKTLPLASGITPNSDAVIPQYRKIGEAVYLRGGIKGITGDNVTIGTLPAGYRPTRVFHFLQNKTASGNVPMVARWKIESDGDIVMSFCEDQPEATHWFALDTSFLVN